MPTISRTLFRVHPSRVLVVRGPTEVTPEQVNSDELNLHLRILSNAMDPPLGGVPGVELKGLGNQGARLQFNRGHQGMVDAGAPLEAPEATRYKEATKAMEAAEAVEDLQTKRPLQRHIDCRLCISKPSSEVAAHRNKSEGAAQRF